MYACPSSSFLGAVEQQDPLIEMDPHWRPQHINLLHPLVTYDHRSLGDVRGRPPAHLRGGGTPPVPIEAQNASPRRKTDSVYDGRPDLVRRVEHLYEKDFELYGY